MRKIISATSILLAVSAYSMPFSTPYGTENLKHSSVYSICQDQQGAIWLNTNSGICRYNGHSLKTYPIPTMMRQFSGNGRDLLYAASAASISKFDIRRTEPTEIDPKGLRIYGSAFLAEDDKLYVGNLNNLYVSDSDTLKKICTIPGKAVISTLMRTRAGKLLAGTQNVGIYEIGDDGGSELLYPLDAKITALCEDSSGCILAGLFEGGVIRFSDDRVQTIGNTQMKEVRSFASDSKGNLYIGAVNGLFKMDCEGQLTEESVGGSEGRPVCSVFIDREDNLWVGTFYNGLFFSNSSFPFSELATPKDLSLIIGLTQDRRGTLWATTDNCGLFKRNSDNGSWSMVPHTRDIKFQCAFYDSQTDMIWAGCYFGELAGINAKTGVMTRYPVLTQQSTKITTIIEQVVRFNGELYLGSTVGLFLFDPARENSVTRKIPQFSDVVYDMKPGPDGSLWLASHGLYCCLPDNSVIQAVDILDTRSVIKDISFDREGAMWLAVSGEGIYIKKGQSIERYIRDANSVTHLPDGRILLCTDNNITIHDSSDWSYLRYDRSCGLNYSPMLNKNVILTLDSGIVLLGGAEGIISLDPALVGSGRHQPHIQIDGISVNGAQARSELTLPYVKNLKLRHDERNFDIDIASFNYSNISSCKTEYLLDGFDTEWHECDVRQKISFMNLSPGKYIFRLRAKDAAGTVAEDRLQIRIWPVWYESLAFKIFVILIIVLVTAYFWKSSNERVRLSEKIRMQEKEALERRSFFVDLSYQMRRPVNLMIGQMEEFFKKYGSRTAGSEDLQDVFSKALKIREMISEYADSQSEALASDSKFLNAAIGAVERNLHSKKVTTSDLAAELNMGKTTLTTKLRETCGKTPREFIEDIRLESAAQMLKDGNLRISEISDSLCFSDARYFSRCFKKKYGVLPSQYVSEGHSEYSDT